MTLPASLMSIKTKPLLVMRLNVLPLQIIGGPEGAFRRIGVVPGGTFVGDRLSGDVLDGGSDWQLVRGDGSTLLNVRVVLETHDGALIGMTYQGLRHGPADVISRLEAGETVEPEFLLLPHQSYF